MKHLRKILAMCMAVVILCGAAVGVSAEGVIFTNELLHEEFPGAYYAVNEWLINTPYWPIDVFAPGFTTKHLINDPRGNGVTIDFELTPYNGFNKTVIVSDIPEELRDVYNEFASSEIQVDPEGILEITNIARRKDSLIFDCVAVTKFGYNGPDSDYFDMYSYAIRLYGVTSDKQTGEILRYDNVFDSSFVGNHRSYGDSYWGGLAPYDKEIDSGNPSVKDVTIPFPEDFDPKKHEYGFCFLAFSTPEFPEEGFTYSGEVHLVNYTKVDEFDLMCKLGDANTDGKVNLSDVSLLLKFCAKWNVDFNWHLADITADRKVNLNDVSAILKTIAGWKL